LEFWRIEPSALLEPVGLTTEALEEPNARVPFATSCALLARARELTGEPALGVFLGMRRRVSTYGFLGFAAMNASSLREALELAVRFASTVSTSITLSLHVEDGMAALRIRENADAGDVRDILQLCFMIGMAEIGRALTGKPLRGSIDLAIPRPAYSDRFPDLLARFRFDQPVTQVVFDAGYLDTPLIAPDRASMRLAKEQCERALCDLGLDGAMVHRVRGLIGGSSGFRGIEEVATCLGMSVRTLKRRLAAQGATFSDLVEQERLHRARLLLRSSQLSLDDITERLGYSTVPNFARAFRRWTGQTPASYRRASSAPPPRSSAN
jgi:AraC-like DNA-binding protein